MPKRRKYSPEQKAVALAFFERLQDFRTAARKSGVAEDVLRFWVGGGEDDDLDLDAPGGAPGDRPQPPPALMDDYPPLFAPSPELREWAKRTFLLSGGPLHNTDHSHLLFGTPHFLWTNVPNQRGGRSVVGQAEIPGGGSGGKWSKARQEFQLWQWFGETVEFLITIDARYFAHADDAAACALIDHELYHCGQRKDPFGCPLFSDQTGRPLFAMRGHDAEEFVGVVRRYGVGAAAGGVADLVAAAQQPPEIARARVALACGTCMKAR